MTWDEAFANHYEEWSAGMTADLSFYIKLAREAEGPLVELAIGNGRVAIPVAQATGKRVIGIDTSPAMLPTWPSSSILTLRRGSTATNSSSRCRTPPAMP